MTLPENANRRTVLRTLGAGMVGGTALVGTTAADPGRGGGTPVAAVSSHGHYAAFPLGPATWKRSTNPHGGRSGDARWRTGPASGGAVRCRVENLPFGRNVGVDVHVGPLGDVDSVTIETETVRTAGGGSATYFLGLYLDAGDDGDFFTWADGRGNTDVWDEFGVDAEGYLFAPADGRYTVDSNTEFTVLNVAGGPTTATLQQLQDGAVSGVEGTTIDGETRAAVYVGVIGTGTTNGTEEIVVESVDVGRS